MSTAYDGSMPPKPPRSSVPPSPAVQPRPRPATFEDIHRTLFPYAAPPTATPPNVKDAIRLYILGKHSANRPR